MLNYQSLVLFIFCSICFILTPNICHSELVYINLSYSVETPIEKRKSVSNKKRKQRFKKPNKTKDVRTSLYITVALMMMLPLFVIIGILLCALFYPILAWLIAGVGLIVLGNGAAIIGGGTAGSNKFYSTQVLSLALWVFFGINLVGSVVIAIIGLVLFGGIPFFWILAIALLVLAIFMLIWVLIIRQQNKGLRNSAKEKEVVE